MRILIDARPCQSGSAFGGIGRYALNFIKNIITQSPSDEFHILLSDHLLIDHNLIRLSLSEYIAPSRFHVFYPPKDAVFFPRSREELIIFSEEIFIKYVQSIQPDVFLITSLVEGLDCPFICCPVPGVKTGAILYDLIPFHHPEEYLKDKRVAQHYYYKIKQLTRCDFLLAISSWSAIEFNETFADLNIPVTNISSGVSDFFRKLPGDNDSRIVLSEKFSLDTTKRILLYVSSFDKRKNHEQLIKAYSSLEESDIERTQLCIVGNGSAEIYSSLLRHGSAAARNHIVFTGKISDDELLLLYNTSYCLVFPSLYEGFGLPVLEAYKCSLPAICSKTTSLIEAAGTEDAFFDPCDTGSITKKIKRVLDDYDLYQRLKSHAVTHASKFTWQKTAITAWSAIRKQYEVKIDSHLHPKKTSNALDIKRFIINKVRHHGGLGIDAAIQLAPSLCSYLCSLQSLEYQTDRWAIISTFNTQCGIASYSKYFIKRAHEEFRYKVFSNFTSVDSILDARLEENVERCFSLGSDSLDILVKSIFNDSFTHVYIAFQDSFFDLDYLKRFLGECLANHLIIIIEFHKARLPYGPLPNKLIPELKSCHLLIVHSRQALDDLNGLGVIDNVLYIPLGCPQLSSHVPQRPSVHKSDHVTIASFGYLLPSKGILELLELFSKVIRILPNTRLELYTSLYQAHPVSIDLLDKVTGLIGQYGLQESVSLVSDYLSDQDVLYALEKSDICILNYGHTLESSSASLRHIMLARKPTVLTDIPIFWEARDSAFLVDANDQGEKVSLLCDIIKILSKHELPNAGHSSVLDEKCCVQSLWIEARDYRHYIPTIFSSIRPRLSKTSDISLLTLGEASHCLRSTSQHKIRLQHVMPNETGVLLHGPYISLSQDEYRITIYGQDKDCRNRHYILASLKSPDAIFIKGTAQDGESLANSRSKLPVIFTADFNLLSSIDDFELVVTGDPFDFYCALIEKRNTESDVRATVSPELLLPSQFLYRLPRAFSIHCSLSLLNAIMCNNASHSDFTFVQCLIEQLGESGFEEAADFVRLHIPDYPSRKDLLLVVSLILLIGSSSIGGNLNREGFHPSLSV